MWIYLEPSNTYKPPKRKRRLKVVKFQILLLFQAVEEGKKLEESRAPKEEGEVVQHIVTGMKDLPAQVGHQGILHFLHLPP